MANMLIYIYYILNNFLIFLLFILIITIFGKAIYDFLNKKLLKSNKKLDILEKTIVSLGIGLCFFLPLSLLIASTKIINFFTLNLPFILFDSFYINKLIQNRELNKIKALKFIQFIKNTLCKKKNIIFIIILLIILIYHTTTNIIFITARESFYIADPFYWNELLSSTVNNGFISENYVTPYYPQGYNMICMYCLSFLINPDFKHIYFFLKFMPITFFLIFIIIFSIIIKKLFHKNYIVLIALIILVRANFLNYRFLRFLPSNLATFLLMLSLYFFVLNLPLYIHGFFVGGIFLINPMAAFYYLFLIFIYIIFYLFRREINKKNYLKDVLKFLITIGLVLLPQIIFLSIYGYNIVDFLISFPRTLGIIEDLGIMGSNPNLLLNLFNSVKSIIIELLSSWFPDVPWYYKQRLQSSSIIFSIFFLFGVIGIFLKSNRLKIKKDRNLIIFLKGTIIAACLFLFLPNLFPSLIVFDYWSYHWILRILEIYCVPIIIMESYTIYFLVEKASILNLKIGKKLFIKMSEYRSKLNFKYLSSQNIIILLLITSSIYIYFIENNNEVLYSSSWNRQSGYPGMRGYYFSDDQIDTIFYIKEFIPPDFKLLVSNFTDNFAYNRIYKLLWNYNVTIWDFTINDVYNNTREILYAEKINYFLINNQYIEIDQLELFLTNIESFDLIYENGRNLIFYAKDLI